MDGEMGDCHQVGRCRGLLECIPRNPGMNDLTVPRSSYGLGWGTRAEPQAESQGIGQHRQPIRSGVKGAMLSESLHVRGPQSGGDTAGGLGAASSKPWDPSVAGAGPGLPFPPCLPASSRGLTPSFSQSPSC